MEPNSNINNYRQQIGQKVQIKQIFMLCTLFFWKRHLRLAGRTLGIKMEQGAMKAETYFLKQALTNSEYYKYIDSKQGMQQLMNKSLNNNYKSKYQRIATFASETEAVGEEAWAFNQSDFKVFIQASGYLLKASKISYLNQQLIFIGSFSYHNGKSFYLSPAYKNVFLSVANKNAQNIYFFTQQSRNQLLLKCSLSFPSDIPTTEKLNQCVKTINKELIAFQYALQAVGLTSKINGYGLRLKKLQLQLKKNIMDSIALNSVSNDAEQLKEMLEQNSSVIRVKQIIENPQQVDTEAKFLKKGGYFQVQKKNSIIFKQSECEQKQLAWKKPLNFGAKQHIIQQKIHKEIQLVQKIISNEHLLKYYVSQKQPTTIYMDFAPKVLKQCIYKSNISSQQLLNYGEQLVKATQLIHQSGIVHRDLKPENILIMGETLKIIDYAESAKVTDEFVQKNYLGFTIPYSPVECALGKEEGFNKKEIDLWSIAIILYQMVFKSIPLFYSHYIGHDILQNNWKKDGQFSIFPICRSKKGISTLQKIISLCSIKGLQLRQQDRLSLKTFRKVLGYLKEFHQSIANFN